MTEYVRQWLTKASNDLKVAEHEIVLAPEDMVTEAICFHCQQAVEKFLKAYLITQGIEFGRTHNLEYLLELCATVDKEFEGLDVGNLTFYAVEIRYPDEFYVPTLAEARESLEIARKVKEFVLKRI